jgi:hypothetical protein
MIERCEGIAGNEEFNVQMNQHSTATAVAWKMLPKL